MAQTIFLIGLMGSGKSTFGKQLAKELGYAFIETDEIIEEEQGKSISKIFEEDGEEYFRQLERKLLLQLQLVDRTVIASGGGMPCYNDNIELMNRLGTTVWLKEDLNVINDRLAHQKSHRPLLKSEKDLSAFMKNMLIERQQFYERAKLIIEKPDCDKVLAELKKLE